MTIQRPILFFADIYKSLTDKPLERENKNSYKLISLISKILFRMDEKEALNRVSHLERGRVRFVERCYTPNISELLKLIFFKIHKLRDKNGDTSLRTLSRETRITEKDLLAIVENLIWHGLVAPTFIHTKGLTKGEDRISRFFNTTIDRFARYRLTAMGFRYFYELRDSGYEDAPVDDEILKGEHSFIEAKREETIRYLTNAIKARKGILVYDIVKLDSLYRLSKLRGFKRAKVLVILKRLKTKNIRMASPNRKPHKRICVIRNQELYARYPRRVVTRIYRILEKNKKALNKYDDKTKAKIIDTLTLYILGYNRYDISKRLNVTYYYVRKYIKTFLPKGTKRWLKK